MYKNEKKTCLVYHFCVKVKEGPTLDTLVIQLTGYDQIQMDTVDEVGIGSHLGGKLLMPHTKVQVEPTALICLF
jgi:hypothetical protein